jgi:ABC-type transporter Mla subunit MlaD
MPAGGLGAVKPGTKSSPSNSPGAAQGGRRAAKRRAAGPARAQVAANDDAPSIGGLIFALQQQPSNRPFQLAAGASGGWLAIGALLVWALLASDAVPAGSSVFASPMMVAAAAVICLPIALFWFLALLAWRAQELKLMSSAMTEVAVRLAEPDRAAEQSAASLGQAVRRQVSFMNEAISRALGRAGELEALVHNEVAALDRSYNENEHKIKGLIQELVGERHALVSTTDKVSETLRSMGGEVPKLIENLSQQQIKLAKIIEGAGQNLIALENQLATASGSLETTLANRTQQLQAVLDDYTVALDATLASRAEALDTRLVERTRSLDAAFSERLALVDDSMQRTAQAIDTAFSDKAQALTTAMETQVQALSDTLGRQAGNIDETLLRSTLAIDTVIDERARTLTAAIENHVRALSETMGRQTGHIDDSLLRSTLAIDTVVSEKARMLTAAMESHARLLSETLGQHAGHLDESMVHGIDAVRRTSDSITRQSLKAIEGLSGQADLLKSVSENLLQQVSSVTSKFDNQGQQIVSAASALESANTRIDSALQKRHVQLNDTLQRLSGKADQLDEVMRGYSATVEGSLAEAEARARHLIQQLALGTAAHAQAAGAEVERLRSQTDAQSQAVVSAFERMRMQTDAQSQAVIAEVERLRAQTDAQASRAIEDMRAKVSGVSQEVSQHLGSIASRFSDTSDDLRSQAARAAANLQAEHEHLRAEAERLPAATRESTDVMRAALNDQLRAFSETSEDLRSQAAHAAASLHAEQERVRAEAERLPIATRESADAMRAALNEQLRALEQLSSLSARERRDVTPPAPLPASAPAALTAGYPAQSGAPPPPPPMQAESGGERWSLGDLLARASRDDEGHTRAFVLDIEGIAGALDPTTASAIWSRFRAGQRGIMVRSIYTADGRASFDEVSERYGRDVDFRRTVDRFLADFERLIRDIEQQSPRAVPEHLVSDAGRVYLFLAHASGRLR